MSESIDSPVPYKVVYSERVRGELTKLVRKAAALGLGRQVLDAVKVFDYRLRIYPQFGKPLRDLATEGQAVWSGTIPPLALHYNIDDARRLVFVVLPFKALPHLGL